MSMICSKTVPQTYVPPTADTEILKTFTRRYNTAYTEAQKEPAPDSNNGDEGLSDKSASYRKCILQDKPGKVNLAAYSAFDHALSTGVFNDFELVPVGGCRPLNGPMAAFAYQLVGAANQQFEVPPAPKLTSVWYATELVELYWCSLLRDTAFSDYATSSTAGDAVAELNILYALPSYTGPKPAVPLTPAQLFRGNFSGENIGPYVSQLLITPTSMGAQPISQQYVTYAPGIDYMTSLKSWFDVQQGKQYGPNVKVSNPQYLHNGRGLAAYTHVDELYEAYFIAYLVLGSLGVPANPQNAYADAMKQNGFGTFGGPDIAAVLAQVAKAALNACWYQKWVVHRRHRPESGAGMVHIIKESIDTFAASPTPEVFNSQALEASFKIYGTYLLSQTFPEGSPAHPAYPTGHGAVGGACITILKFFFNGQYVFSYPQLPTADGTSLVPYHPSASVGDPGQLTLNGELHKLAHNITFGHGLHGGIHWRSDSDESIKLGEKVALAFLDDLACSYAESVNITITLLDGPTHTIKN